MADYLQIVWRLWDLNLGSIYMEPPQLTANQLQPQLIISQKSKIKINEPISLNSLRPKHAIIFKAQVFPEKETEFNYHQHNFSGLTRTVKSEAF